MPICDVCQVDVDGLLEHFCRVHGPEMIGGLSATDFDQVLQRASNTELSRERERVLLLIRQWGQWLDRWQGGSVDTAAAARSRETIAAFTQDAETTSDPTSLRMHLRTLIRVIWSGYQERTRHLSITTPPADPPLSPLEVVQLAGNPNDSDALRGYYRQVVALDGSTWLLPVLEDTPDGEGPPLNDEELENLAQGLLGVHSSHRRGDWVTLQREQRDRLRLSVRDAEGAVSSLFQSFGDFTGGPVTMPASDVERHILHCEQAIAGLNAALQILKPFVTPPTEGLTAWRRLLEDPLQGDDERANVAGAEE